MTEAFSTGDKLTLTLKAGRDFDAPWAVIHGSSVEEAMSILCQLDPDVGETVDAKDYPLAVAKAAVNFQAKSALAKGLNVTVVPDHQPEQPPQFPAGVQQAIQETFPTEQPPAQLPQQPQQPQQPQWAPAPQQQPAMNGWDAQGPHSQQFAPQLPQQPQPQFQQPQQQYAPQGQQQPQQWGQQPQAPAGMPQPSAPPPSPSGYTYVWKSGIGKNGRPYNAWMSGQPQELLAQGMPKDPTIWVR